MADLESSISIKILDAFTAPLRKLKDGLGLVEEAGDKARKKLALAADLNQAAEAAGRFGHMIIGPLKGAVNEFAGFDHALSKLSAMGGGARGSSVFEAMKEQALDLGAATQYSAQEVAELQTNFLKANFSTAQTMSIVKQTMAAATAEGIGLAETSTIVAGALRGMRYDVSETARVTDVLAAVSVKSDADMRGMADALVYAGPVAQELGMSFELTAAMLGKLSDAQIKNSMAGTGFKATLMQLLKKPGRDEVDAWDKLGLKQKGMLQVQKAIGAGHADVALRKMGQAMKDMPNEKRLQLLGRLVGQEAAGAASVLINASMDDSNMGLGTLDKELHAVAGQTQKMADIMADDLMGSLERAGGAVSGLNTAIGEAFAPTVKDASLAVEGLTGSMSKWVKANPKATEAAMTFVATLGAISFTAKGVLLAASAYQSLSAAVIAARVAADGSKASHLGLALAAGAAGYAIGTWISDTFDLSNRISAAAGRANANADRPADENGVKDYGGGWRVNEKTGEVLKMGTGEGPLSVRRARARGANTKDEISALMRDEIARESYKPMAIARAKKGPGDLLSMQARDAGLLASPMRHTGMTEENAAAATREQTAALLVTLRAQQKAAEAAALALEEMNRRLGVHNGVQTIW